MLSWVKFVCLAFQSSQSSVHVPLLLSHQLGFYSTIAMPSPLGSHFYVPSQLGSTEPLSESGTTLRIDNPVDAVKHEGPATRMWQKEDICHALTLRHSRRLTSFLLHLITLSWAPPPSFPSSRPGTASFTLLPFDATGKPLTRWRLALAQEAVRGASFFYRKEGT